MIDRTKPIRYPKLSESERDAYRLQEIIEIRLANLPYLQCIDSTKKRNALVLLKMAEDNAGFKKWLKEQLYEDPKFFEKFEMTPTDTTLRDNREIEKLGFFVKPENDAYAPEKPQQKVIQQTL